MWHSVGPDLSDFERITFAIIFLLVGELLAFAKCGIVPTVTDIHLCVVGHSVTHRLRPKNKNQFSRYNFTFRTSPPPPTSLLFHSIVRELSRRCGHHPRTHTKKGSTPEGRRTRRLTQQVVHQTSTQYLNKYMKYPTIC